MPPASLFQLEIKMDDDLLHEMGLVEEDLEERDHEDCSSSGEDQDDIDELLDELLGEE